jgi:hypothetical protein
MEPSSTNLELLLDVGGPLANSTRNFSQLNERYIIKTIREIVLVRPYRDHLRFGLTSFRQTSRAILSLLLRIREAPG